MFGVLLSDVLDSKVVDDQRELDGPGDMLPKAGCVGNFIVACWCEAFSEQ